MWYHLKELPQTSHLFQGQTLRDDVVDLKESMRQRCTHPLSCLPFPGRSACSYLPDLAEEILGVEDTVVLSAPGGMAPNWHKFYEQLA